MTTRVTIRNDGPEGLVAVTVVTVSSADAAEAKHLLPPEGSVSLELAEGQFLMVDDSEED